MLMSVADESVGVLNQIKALGVSISLDDFGTGYSSLAYLKRMPVDELKIDRSFVNGLPDDGDNAAIVRAIVGLSGSLGFEVIAEGVETRAQLDSLRSLGCDEVQGYFYARPMPAQELPGWTRRFDGTVPGAVHTGPGVVLRAVPGAGDTARRVPPDDPVGMLRL